MAVNMQFKNEISARFTAWCRANNRPYPSERDGQVFFSTSESLFPAVKTWIGKDWLAFRAFLIGQKLVKETAAR